MSPDFLIPLCEKFKHWITDEHGKLLEIPYTTEISLFRDTEMWELDPHTDQRNEILGLFLYLPPNDSTSHLGTSVYTPKEPGLAAEEFNSFPRKYFKNRGQCKKILKMILKIFRVITFLQKSFFGHGSEII